MAIERVAIIGKGAVGLLYGSIIAKNLGENHVSFVMDDARFARKGGDVVTVNGNPCTIPTVSASEARESAPADLAILAVKATGLTAALDTLASVVGPETRIMSLLNGIRSEEFIAERFGWERTVLSICQGMDAVFLGGALTFSHTGEIRFGAAEGTEPGVTEDIAAFLARAGITNYVEADIRHRLWVKLMLNVGINQTCMAYGGSYGSASEPGEQNRCFIAAMREARVVANAEGVDVTEADLSQMAALVASLAPEGLPSMAQDRVAQRLTEVDEFAGTIIERAEKHGLLVPQNRWLYERIRQIEASW